MKKATLIIIMALISVCVSAQKVGFTGYVDEIDIAGTWRVTSIEGNIYGDNDYEYFVLNSYGWGSVSKSGDEPMIAGYSITNANKLHLERKDAPSYNFLILDYRSSKPRYLKIQTYDGKCTMEWEQTQATNEVREITYEQQSDSKYNLQGMKVEDPEGVYIQNGKKYIRK